MDELIERLRNFEGSDALGNGDFSLLHEAAAALEAARAEVERLREEVDALREALAGLITWTPSAATYRRLGLDPDAPMRALAKARAALAKEGGLRDD